eukprot:scaffold30241_cov89-Isochrysis_galbana.AAC.7
MDKAMAPQKNDSAQPRTPLSPPPGSRAARLPAARARVGRGGGGAAARAGGAGARRVAQGGGDQAAGARHPSRPCTPPPPCIPR